VVIGGHSSPATAAFERLASALTGDTGPESSAEQPGKKRSRRRLGFARD
jgi:hypothetical protein